MRTSITRILLAGLVAGLFVVAGVAGLARPAYAGAEVAIKVSAEEERVCEQDPCPPVTQLKIDIKCPLHPDSGGRLVGCDGSTGPNAATGTVECERAPQRPAVRPQQKAVTCANFVEPGVLEVYSGGGCTTLEAVWEFGTTTAQSVRAGGGVGTVCDLVGDQDFKCAPGESECTIKSQVKNAP